MGGRPALAGALAALALALCACTAAAPDRSGRDRSAPDPAPSGSAAPGEKAGEETDEKTGETTRGATGEITIALAGDVHFEAHLARLLRDPAGLGPIADTLRDADLAMLNLEAAITERGRRAPKELEDADNRYHFRAPARALDVLGRAGVDVVSVANNHVGDFGTVGIADTLAARAEAAADERRGGPAEVIGVGRDEADAFTPHRIEVDGLGLAVLAADASFREGSSPVWSAGSDNAGVAAARQARPDALLDAVRSSKEAGDLVVVYLHWGREQQSCPTQRQRLLGSQLAEAGADVVVGSHSHVLSGAGWSGDTYVAYGLGNFAWYHDRQPDTGVLTLRLDADGVVEDTWTPARIAAGGRPLPVRGAARAQAVTAWEQLRGCTGLGAARGEEQADDPAYASSIRRIGAELATRMDTSHRAGCPVPLRDLRYLRMTFRDFEGRARTGEMVVHRRWARGVASAFGRLYDAGFPIARMRLVDDYGGSDDRSMAANNTSGFNCRRVAGQPGWSDHAYGAAIDINPVQNPYVQPGTVDPPNGRRFASVGRSGGDPAAAGVIRSGDVVVAAFARIGWTWGGDWVSSKDYQHLNAGGGGGDGRA